jgi:hypothetical protein
MSHGKMWTAIMNVLPPSLPGAHAAHDVQRLMYAIAFLDAPEM